MHFVVLYCLICRCALGSLVRQLAAIELSLCLPLLSIVVSVWCFWHIFFRSPLCSRGKIETYWVPRSKFRFGSSIWWINWLGFQAFCKTAQWKIQNLRNLRACPRRRSFFVTAKFCIIFFFRYAKLIFFFFFVINCIFIFFFFWSYKILASVFLHPTAR